MGLTEEYVEWLESDESLASYLHIGPDGSVIM